jgi:parallel beta-helix repeat protein
MRNEDGDEGACELDYGLNSVWCRRNSRHSSAGVIGVCLVVVLAASFALTLAPGARASPTPAYATAVKVPCGASIQGAINAAYPGETIVLAPCTYVQQLTIDKSVNILGAGAGKTIIQSPAGLKPDAFGDPWTIEIGNAATVTLSGITLLVTLQCIVSSPYAADVFQLGYAGGGIGVGGSAYLDLQSSVVTTTGAAQGASCNEGAGFMSYGTGVDFGLDYVTGTPAASQLVGFGAVSGVLVSGFGFGGPGIAVGGTANSPAGSSAVISHDYILTLGTTGPCCGAPLTTGVAVGLGENASSATIVDNVMNGVAGTSTFAVWVVFGSSAYIAHNSLISTGWANAVSVEVFASATITDNNIVIGYSPWCVGCGVAWGVYVVVHAQATITYNSIAGPAVDGIGVYLWNSTATVEYNSIGQMTCEYNATFGAFGASCGPSWATQYAGYGIFDLSDAGHGTVIANNLIFDNDAGIVLDSGCPACVVENNILLNNLDYGLAGIDGAYGFLQNVVIGGMYGVGAIAFSVDTTITLSHVVIVGPSVAPFYYEIDFTGGTATIVGK